MKDATNQFSKLFISVFIPVLLAIVLYQLYDASLNSPLTFFVYSLLGLASVVSVFTISSNKKSLIKPFIFFEITYLSVYIFSIVLGLNTSFFDFIKGVAFSLVSFATCAVIALFIFSLHNRFLNKLFRFIFLIILFAFVLLPCILICYLIATGSLISSDIIIALAQTNPTEGSEFFMANVNYRWGLALFALVIIYLFNLKGFSSVSGIKKGKYLASMSICIVLFSSIFLALPRMDYLPFSVIKVTGKQLDNFKVYKEKKAQRMQLLNNLNTITLSNDTDRAGNLFVLVIGESETRDRMQAYGFNRPTTPKLVEALKSKNNILFENAYSSWPQTVQALSYALTESNQYVKEDSNNAFSLLEVARAAGFETYWISNQRKYGMYETPITVISSTANHEVWTNGSSKMEGVFFDEELVKRFPDNLDTSKNTLIVVHLMGSHQKYKKRLPSQYFVFKNGENENYDEYDDTILYTDHIVDELYKKASAYKNFKGLVYFSDHGENPNIVGGHDPVNVDGQMLRIPLVVYLSDKFIEYRKDVYDTLVANKDKYFSNDLIFNLVIGILGIDGIPDYSYQLNIGSDKYELKQDDVLTMYGKNHINEFLSSKK